MGWWWIGAERILRGKIDLWFLGSSFRKFPSRISSVLRTFTIPISRVQSFRPLDCSSGPFLCTFEYCCAHHMLVRPSLSHGKEVHHCVQRQRMDGDGT